MAESTTTPAKCTNTLLQWLPEPPQIRASSVWQNVPVAIGITQERFHIMWVPRPLQGWPSLDQTFMDAQGELQNAPDDADDPILQEPIQPGDKWAATYVRERTTDDGPTQTSWVSRHLYRVIEGESALERWHDGRVHVPFYRVPMGEFEWHNSRTIQLAAPPQLSIQDTQSRMRWRNSRTIEWTAPQLSMQDTQSRMMWRSRPFDRIRNGDDYGARYGAGRTSSTTERTLILGDPEQFPPIVSDNANPPLVGLDHVNDPPFVPISEVRPHNYSNPRLRSSENDDDSDSEDDDDSDPAQSSMDRSDPLHPDEIEADRHLLDNVHPEQDPALAAEIAETAHIGSAVLATSRQARRYRDILHAQMFFHGMRREDSPTWPGLTFPIIATLPQLRRGIIINAVLARVRVIEASIPETHILYNVAIASIAACTNAFNVNLPFVGAAQTVHDETLLLFNCITSVVSDAFIDAERMSNEVIALFDGTQESEMVGVN